MTERACFKIFGSHYCFVCGQIQDSHAYGISYHKIRKGSEREWLSFFGITLESLKFKVKNALFCNRHFDPSDFIYVGEKKMRTLRKGSMPSIQYIDDATLLKRKTRVTVSVDDDDGFDKQQFNPFELFIGATPKNRGRYCFFCKDRSKPGLSLFKFPKNERKKQWLRACKFESVPDNALLCDQHFERRQFSKLPNTYGYAILEKTAIPTIFYTENEKLVEIAKENNENKKLINKKIETIGNSKLCDKLMEIEPKNKKEVNTGFIPRASTPTRGLNSFPSEIYSSFREHSYCKKLPSQSRVKKSCYAGDVTSPYKKSKRTSVAVFNLMKCVMKAQKCKFKIHHITKRISKLLKTMEEIRRNNILSENGME